MRKRWVALLLVAAMSVTLVAGCGKGGETADNEQGTPTSGAVGGNAEQGSENYQKVMARFTGELEEGAVVKVLENDTAIELGYVDQLIEAFNKAYEDKGIRAERMNVDQYSDLATDGPYGFGPDVWYQANDIIMKYADNQHILPLPVYSMEAYEQIPENAWDAYAKEMYNEEFYCGIPVNVQSGMLYYRKSLLPDDWKTTWDLNQNDVPDMFETYTALYAYSKMVQNGEIANAKTKFGYLDDLVDTYFMAGYLLTFGGYVFGNDNTNPDDIGFAAGNAKQGAYMVQQWAELLNDTRVLDKAFASAAYASLASGEMLCTITTPDVYQMFITAMVNSGMTKEEAEDDIVMVNVPRLPKSGDLTADNWQDTITDMENLTYVTKAMGGINGYGISAYTTCPNASLAFLNFAAGYEQVLQRNSYLGIVPARADAANEIGKTDSVVEIMFSNLDNGIINIMPAISEVGQIWTPAESFFTVLATDPYNPKYYELPRAYETMEQIQAGLEKMCSQIHDAIFTLAN